MNFFDSLFLSTVINSDQHLSRVHLLTLLFLIKVCLVGWVFDYLWEVVNSDDFYVDLFSRYFLTVSSTGCKFPFFKHFTSKQILG